MTGEAGEGRRRAGGEQEDEEELVVQVKPPPGSVQSSSNLRQAPEFPESRFLKWQHYGF